MPTAATRASSSTGPKTHSQPSRKSKRSWRKNIDLESVTAGLENARTERIITGDNGLLADQPASALFQSDTAGDPIIHKRVRKDHGRPLKADEILAQRSAVPALASRKRPGDSANITDGVLPASKRNKKGGVSHLDYQRLRQIAYGGDDVHKDVVERPDTAVYDPWAVGEQEQMPQDPRLSFLDPPKPARAPSTLKRAPITLRADGRIQANISKPGAGKSYNPKFDDWAELLSREGEKEVAAEKKRLRAAEKEADRLERVAKAAEEAEKENAEKEMFGDYYESEWEGIQSDVDETQLSKKRPQRKTPAERNKITRRKEAERITQHEARMKERDAQAKRIKAIKQEIDAKDTARKQAIQKFEAPADSDDATAEELEGQRLRRRNLGKYAVPEAPLELVLPDELQDSLRLLKPEGNLLNDRFRNMMVQGKVEARKPITQPKKAKKKATEKWSYKDWRL